MRIWIYIHHNTSYLIISLPLTTRNIAKSFIYLRHFLLVIARSSHCPTIHTRLEQQKQHAMEWDARQFYLNSLHERMVLILIGNNNKVRIRPAKWEVTCIKTRDLCYCYHRYIIITITIKVEILDIVVILVTLTSQHLNR